MRHRVGDFRGDWDGDGVIDFHGFRRTWAAGSRTDGKKGFRRDLKVGWFGRREENSGYVVDQDGLGEFDNIEVDRKK